MQEFGWTGTLQSDLLVYPDILEECRSEESVRTECRGLESVGRYDRHADLTDVGIEGPMRDVGYKVDNDI